MPRLWGSRATANSDSPQIPSRTSAIAMPMIAPPASATQAPPGSVRCRCATRRTPRSIVSRSSAAGCLAHSTVRASASAAATSVGAIGRMSAAAGTPGSQAGARMHYPSAAPWPFRSRSSRTAARTSAAPSTRSRRRRTTRARSATARACRIGSARCAARTPDARSCTSTRTTTTTSTSGPRAAYAVRSAALSSLPPMNITVAVDANGADLGPSEVAQGAAEAAAHGVRVLLFGPADAMGDAPDGVRIVDAPVSIAKAADPAAAVRATPDASIVRAAKAVADGDADALVSGGSTGPALAAALFNIRRARGIHRPALAIPVPVPDHPVIIVDVGANVEVRPEHLVQFGFMGAALAETLLGVERPRIGLPSTGEEATKGTPLVVETHAAMRDRIADGGTYEFAGNVEGNEIPTGRADVIVTDGFTGNIVLKLMEGVSEAMLRNIR